MTVLLGLDIGGTKIEAALLRLRPEQQGCEPSAADFAQIRGLEGQKFSLQLLYKERIATRRQQGYAAAFAGIVNLCLNSLKQAELSPADLEGIGLALPGPVAPRTQRMLTGNSGIFRDQSIGDQLKDALGFRGPVVSGNDANCFTLAEAMAGAVSEAACTLGVILGTGVGGGVFLTLSLHLFIQLTITKILVFRVCGRAVAEVPANGVILSWRREVILATAVITAAWNNTCRAQR